MRVLENEQHEVPSAEALATLVGLSPPYFSRLFAAQVGETSAAYGRRIRLDHSINRLRYDPSPMNVVAADFGYTSQAAFTRAFAEQFGMAPRDYMAKVASAQPPLRAPLPGPVRLIRRAPTMLAARRFFGNDYPRWWRTFVAELPDGLRAGARWIGLSYDDPRVTPDRHVRCDCCVALDARAWCDDWSRAGLDLIELPGGLHGEVDAVADIDALRDLVGGLLADWLPTRPGLAPEGDPLPMFFAGDPMLARVAATVAIRVRERGDVHEPNARVVNATGG